MSIKFRLRVFRKPLHWSEERYEKFLKEKSYFKNLGKGLFEIVDKETKKVTGIAIVGFKKRTKNLKELKVSLPMKIELLTA